MTNRFLIPLMTALILLMPRPSLAGDALGQVLDDDNLVVIRGRVVCLDQSGRRLDSLLDCSGALYALADGEGRIYTLAQGDSGASMFTDARVRIRDLQVTGQLNSKGQIEVIRVRSVREGKFYDIYYFCELCNIRAYAPGLCPCCRNELEFRETPV